jgi:hypothetical protein
MNVLTANATIKQKVAAQMARRNHGTCGFCQKSVSLKHGVHVVNRFNEYVLMHSRCAARLKAIAVLKQKPLKIV